MCKDRDNPFWAEADEAFKNRDIPRAVEIMLRIWTAEKPTEKPTRCAFVGVMNLAPDLIAQTTVAKVECPECGAMRTLHPQGHTVTFPSYPKRKTGAPRDEVRWIRRGTTWELTEQKASFMEAETERE